MNGDPKGPGAVGAPATDRKDDRVQIFDTTLRDGEQSPGISLNTAEKVEIAQQLERLGVDVIEAGFPITSPGDFEAVTRIAQTVTEPVICALARTHKADIDSAWGALRDAERPRIHTFISTSDIHIAHQLRTDRDDVRGQARAAVAHARSLCDDVEFSPMDATRAELEFTAEICQIAVDEGATVVNIPDTVGYTTPTEFAAFLEGLIAAAPGLRDIRLSVHCHDDLGLAVANSYAGVLAGARQVECAINGIGERAGNCSLEEIVMLLRTRGELHGLEVGTVTPEISRTSRLVSRLTGYPVQPNKAIVGRNAFAHESGIHQDGVLKERTTFEIMDPVDVGLESNSIVLGKHSGRHALKDALEQLGYSVDGQALRQAFDRFKEIADKKKQVTALDLEAIVSDEMRTGGDSYELDWFEASSGSRSEPRARVSITMPDGERAEGASGGDGPIEAVFGAISDATKVEPALERFTVGAVTEGYDALGEVTVVLRAHGHLATGTAVATDIIEASAWAYVRALSNALEGAAVREAEALAAEAAGEPSPRP
ncbi:2-isopropylmalate synthase [Thermoleophilia bacterium SCSIO 60948]|nr:2-isopropylmalate synthase [Thermoleophilia bacterium SCSIO 60948]